MLRRVPLIFKLFFIQSYYSTMVENIMINIQQIKNEWFFFCVLRLKLSIFMFNVFLQTILKKMYPPEKKSKQITPNYLQNKYE